MGLILLVLVVEEAWIVVLLHELLRRLIDIHVGNLFRSLSSLFLLSRCFLLLCSSLLILNAFELLKNVLIVQQGVGEFIHKCRACEESINAALEDGNLEQLMDCRPLSWVSL